MLAPEKNDVNELKRNWSDGDNLSACPTIIPCRKSGWSSNHHKQQSLNNSPILWRSCVETQCFHMIISKWKRFTPNRKCVILLIESIAYHIDE